MDIFILFADGILGVDFGNVAVIGRDRFFELRLFGLFVFAGFGGLSIELLGCELRREVVLADEGEEELDVLP